MKHTDKLGHDTKEWKEAVQVMCEVPKLANDMMNVGRLQGFNVSASRNTVDPLQVKLLYVVCSTYSRLSK